MKYENAKVVNDLLKQIAKDEKELERLSSYDTTQMKIIIVSNGYTGNIATVGIGDYEHPYTKSATTFIEDCIQILRNKITKSKNELEKL